MRGVVALAAANSLPLTLNDGSPFPQRNFIIFLTFSLILMTLVVQGLCLPWLVRMLGLSAGNAQFCEEGEARHLVLQAAIDFLKERMKSAEGEHEEHIYDDLLHQYQSFVSSSATALSNRTEPVSADSPKNSSAR
jgi:monovalent cation/hydrogen antiporter